MGKYIWHKYACYVFLCVCVLEGVIFSVFSKYYSLLLTQKQHNKTQLLTGVIPEINDKIPKVKL